MTRKIAFISALGGQGCTLATAYVAKAAACEGHAITLVDFGGFAGTLSYVLGVDGDVVLNLSDVMSGECAPEDALIDCDGNLNLLPSATFSERIVDPYSADVKMTVDHLSQDRDVFVDLPAGTIPDAGMAECFDLFVICSRTDAMSLKFASALCRHIRKAVSHVTDACEIRLLLTRFNPDYMRIGGVSDIDECIDKVGARLIGVLPQDIHAMAAAMSGQPPDEKTELMRYSRDIVRRIYGSRIPLDPVKTLRFR